MNKKQAKKMAAHPKVKGYTEKFAHEIAQILTDQFEVAKNQAQENNGEFKFDMNVEIKKILEEKGKEMGTFIKSFTNEQQQKEMTRATFKNHAIKVSIR